MLKLKVQTLTIPLWVGAVGVEDVRSSFFHAISDNNYHGVFCVIFYNIGMCVQNDFAFSLI